MTENEIVNLAQQYGLQAEIKNSIVYVRSLANTWYFYLSDININNITLYHRCIDSTKEKFHRQRKFLDLDFMFKSLVDHDKHMFIERKKSRKETLFDIIEQERKQKSVKNFNRKTKKIS